MHYPSLAAPVNSLHICEDSFWEFELDESGPKKSSETFGVVSGGVSGGAVILALLGGGAPILTPPGGGGNNPEPLVEDFAFGLEEPLFWN